MPGRGRGGGGGGNAADMEIVVRDGKTVAVRQVAEVVVSKERLAKRLERMADDLTTMDSNLAELQTNRDATATEMVALQAIHDQMD